jgi:hypothetical protein
MAACSQPASQPHTPTPYTHLCCHTQYCQCRQVSLGCPWCCSSHIQLWRRLPSWHSCSSSCSPGRKPTKPRSTAWQPPGRTLRAVTAGTAPCKHRQVCTWPGGQHAIVERRAGRAEPGPARAAPASQQCHGRSSVARKPHRNPCSNSSPRELNPAPLTWTTLATTGPVRAYQRLSGSGQGQERTSAEFLNSLGSVVLLSRPATEAGPTRLLQKSLARARTVEEVILRPRPMPSSVSNNHSSKPAALQGATIVEVFCAGPMGFSGWTMAGSGVGCGWVVGGRRRRMCTLVAGNMLAGWHNKAGIA